MDETQTQIGWLAHTRTACRRFEDPVLSLLLLAELALIFIMEPLAAEGFGIPEVVTMLLVAVLILVLALASRQRWVLVIATAAGLVRLLGGLAEHLWSTSVTKQANAVSAVLGLVALMWMVAGVVFGPGRVTPHRVRGAVLLYLTIALIFAWIYRLIDEIVPGAIPALGARHGTLGALSTFVYYSLTVLTTVGFGDITPVDAFARNLTMFEALLGQLYPTIILAQILTLYAEDRKQQE